MSAPLPDALRTRFQRLIKEGLSGRAAALRLKQSPATGARWALSIRPTGQVCPTPQGRPKGKGNPDPYHALSRTHGVRAPIFSKLEAHLRRIGAPRLHRHARRHRTGLRSLIASRMLDANSLCDGLAATQTEAVIPQPDPERRRRPTMFEPTGTARGWIAPSAD